MDKEDLTLGHEYINCDEESIIAEMVNEMQVQMEEMYADKKMLRQIHTKMHGCVKALFIIESKLDEKLKVGLFKDDRNYDAWVRFSNANTVPQKDGKKDIRGIAIKLMDVHGEKILNDQDLEKTQDFLLMSSNTFFAHNLKAFRGTMKAFTAKSKIKLLLYFLNPLHWSIVGRLLKSMIKCDNPASIPYWSTQPYQFGTTDCAVKYFLKPHPDNIYTNEDLNDHDFLRINLAQTLVKHPLEFDFFIQFQTDAILMPIEDPTIPWNSEMIKVATLKIPRQTFDQKSQMDFGENLSFNAWHSLPEHRPLGSFNRARKRAYEAMSIFRHQYNQLKMSEPKSSKDFWDGTSFEKSENIEFTIPTKGLIKKSGQVLVSCSKNKAFKYISDNIDLPNWVRKSGPISGVKGVEILIGPYNHIGAQRKCLCDDGSSFVEQLISYNPDGNYSYSISQFSNIVKHLTNIAYATIWFDTIGDQTRITWDYSFTSKNIFAKMGLWLFLLFGYKKFLNNALKWAKINLENGD
jgi:hypothetical protein